MSTLKKIYLFVVTWCLLILPCGIALAGGSNNVVIVSDTRKLTGIMHWWGSCYNESHAQFTLITVILIPVVGCIFGWMADKVMGWMGIDLTKRKVSE